MIETKNLMDLKEFLEKLSEIEIKEVEVPHFYIPNWPKEAKVTLNLGKKEYLFPTTTEETGLYYLKKRRNTITCKINKSGDIKFTIHMFSDDEDYSSNSENKLNRIRALILFHQFKEEIFPQAIQLLKKDLGGHNQVLELVKRAFGPFIPFLVADRLGS